MWKSLPTNILSNFVGRYIWLNEDRDPAPQKYRAQGTAKSLVESAVGTFNVLSPARTLRSPALKSFPDNNEKTKVHETKQELATEP